MDITRGFFHGRFPVKFAKLSKIFLEGVRLRHSVLLVYNERTFFRPRHHRGTLHKEPLAAVKQSHRKEGYRRFRPASAVRLSAQARFRAAKNF